MSTGGSDDRARQQGQQRGRGQGEQQARQPAQQAAQQPSEHEEIQPYTRSDEEVSYVLTHRPTGVVNWIKAKLGFGMTYWYVTNQRLIEYRRVSGGFGFRDVPLGKVSSASYGRRLRLGLVALGILIALGGLATFLATDLGLPPLAFGGLGVLVVLYAYYRRRQVLAVHASGGVKLVLDISKGETIDDFLWYLHAEPENRE